MNSRRYKAVSNENNGGAFHGTYLRQRTVGAAALAAWAWFLFARA